MEGEDVDYLQEYYMKECHINPIKAFLDGYQDKEKQRAVKEVS